MAKMKLWALLMIFGYSVSFQPLPTRRNWRLLSRIYPGVFRSRFTRTMSVTADDASASEEAQCRKAYTVTVCMVPPPEYEQVWQKVSEMRKLLKDPGFYRWPPHANLLYPFLDIRKEDLSATADALREAAKKCEPFTISLDSYGVFGGKRRGVLWLSPHSENSSPNTLEKSNSKTDDEPAPLMKLQSALEEAFPMCRDVSRKSDDGKFHPHVTISHFASKDDALAAQAKLEKTFDLEDLSFTLDRIYLLKRKGDGGQFERVAEIYLGSNSVAATLFGPPKAFPGMPKEEAGWVHKERMQQKARRKGRGRGGGGGRRPRNPNRIPDTPEVIAAKRAERKAKRERLEREAESRDTQEKNT